MIMYHGTSKENAEAIRACGYINGPVFVTVIRETALGYAFDGGEVFEVEVDEDELMVDLDLPGAKLVSVETAVAMEGLDDGTTVSELIRMNYSFAVDRAENI